MRLDRTAALNVLRKNVGFDEPERWIDYAIAHSFAEVDAAPVVNCPHCGQPPASRLGQYVYYSTLIQLRTCGVCHLIWADAHIDPQIVQAHFETGYKDRHYFEEQRSWVFDDLVGRIAAAAPSGGSVLDVGGAQGDLMHLLQRRRPDLDVFVQDLSEQALDYAGRVFGLRTLCGDIGTLAQHDRQYSVVVLSDVLYYEPRLAEVWRILPKLVQRGGTVIIRVPNKLALIRAYQYVWRLKQFLQRDCPLQDDVKYYNPEHIYILSQRYLLGRLRECGFRHAGAVCSPPLVGLRSPAKRLVARMVYSAMNTFAFLSRGNIVLTPSMLLIGAELADNGRR